MSIDRFALNTMIVRDARQFAVDVDDKAAIAICDQYLTNDRYPAARKIQTVQELDLIAELFNALLAADAA